MLTNHEAAIRDEVVALASKDEAVLLGPIRQELLSGLTPHDRFVQLREALRIFTDERLLTIDYERAAQMFTQCKVTGIQGSDTDYLICAVAERLRAPILTSDRDFANFARVLPIRLHNP
jgi:hypothetical protein